MMMAHSSNDYCGEGDGRGCNTFFQTTTAIGITSAAATTSAVSSLVILVIIGRSQIQLRSVYHRIIASMAFFDLIGSMAMALTTVPMPRDTIYPYHASMYGNVQSCEAQGFFFVFGCSGSFLINCGLHIFYVSIIQFRTSDCRIRFVLEPCIHVVTWVFAIVTSVFLLVYGLYNPHPYESYCSVSPYPYLCATSEEECIRGDLVSHTGMIIAHNVFVFIVACGALNLFVCAGFIIFGSWKDHTFPNHSCPNNSDHIAWRAMRKTLCIQASMYIGGFILTYAFAVLGLFGENNVVYGLYCFFFPLQGFYNGFMFISHKVHNMKRVRPSLTIGRAVKLILTQPIEMQELQISGLSIVSCRSEVDFIDDISKSSLGPSVEDASKNVQLSCFSSHGELSFMFDGGRFSSTCAPKESECSVQPKKDAGSDMKSTEEMDDLEDDFFSKGEEDLSFGDDSTVQATSRIRNVL